MGSELTEVTTPRGVRVLRMDVEGLVDEAHSLKNAPVLQANTLPLLVVLKGDLKFTPAGRKGITSINNQNPVPAAIVTKSAAMRAMLSFVIKAVAIATQKKVTSATFNEEAPAIEWLEQQAGAVKAA